MISSAYKLCAKIIERDTGTALFTLVRVSHIHFFGLTFVFFILGMSIQRRSAIALLLAMIRTSIRGCTSGLETMSHW